MLHGRDHRHNVNADLWPQPASAGLVRLIVLSGWYELIRLLIRYCPGSASNGVAAIGTMEAIV